MKPVAHTDDTRSKSNRKTRRKFHGTIKEDGRAWKFFWFVMVIPWTAAFMIRWVQGYERIDINTIQEGTQVVGAFLLIFVVVSSVSGVIRWLLYWPLGYYVLQEYSDIITVPSIVMISTLVALEVLTILIHLFFRHGYPLLVRDVFSVRAYWCYRKSKKQNRFSYHATADLYCRRNPCQRCKVSFTGDIHPITGRPHGYGSWLDDEFYGECLQGWWKDGLPVGPFISRQTGSSSVFLCLRIAFVTNSTDGLFVHSHLSRMRHNLQHAQFYTIADMLNNLVVILELHMYLEWHTRALIPVLTEELGFGVASVECSMSGTFLSYLPHVISPFIVQRFTCSERRMCSSVCTCVKVCSENLMPDRSPEEATPAHHRQQIMVTSDDAGLTLSIPAFQLRAVDSISAGKPGLQHDRVTDQVLHMASAMTDDSFLPNIEKEEQKTAMAPGQEQQKPEKDREIVMRLRKTNQSTADSRSVFSLYIPQFVTIPVEPVALVLIPGYNCPLIDALKRMAQMCSLARFPPHIKPFVFHWPSGNVPSYFLARRVAESDLMRQHFTKFVKGLMEAGFKSLHVLAHSMGARVLFNGFEGCQKLFWDTDYNISRTELSSSNSYGENIPNQRGKIRFSSLTLLHPDYPLANFVKDFPSYRRACGLVTLYADTFDVALKWAERGTKQTSLGRHLRRLCEIDDEGHIRWLNMDVMDTSSVTNNVHTLRHSFFDLNQTVIEDLRELITTGKR